LIFDFSEHAIRLTYCLKGWSTVLGDVHRQSPRFGADMADLTQRARALQPDPLLAQVVLPRSQVIYRAVPWLRAKQVEPAEIEDAAARLARQDPQELVVDWDHGDAAICLAVVERITLTQTATFLHDHGVIPVAFTSRPRTWEFPRPPRFSLAERGRGDASSP
jgi:hypothetical protein